MDVCRRTKQCVGRPKIRRRQKQKDARITQAAPPLGLVSLNGRSRAHAVASAAAFEIVEAFGSRRGCGRKADAQGQGDGGDDGGQLGRSRLPLGSFDLLISFDDPTVAEGARVVGARTHARARVRTY